jgi:N-acetylneuraminic acid mutarotase
VAPVGLLLTLLACEGGEPLSPHPAELTATPVSASGWATRASMPTARGALGVAVVNGILYAVGGAGASSPALATVEAYTPGNDTWESRAPLPEGRSHLNASVIDGILYVAGGLEASGQPTATLYSYDDRSDTWTSKAPMRAAGACGASGVIDGRLYVFTTSCSSAVLGADPAFQRYDPATDSWTELTLPAWGHYLPAGGAAGGKFYLAGGLFETSDPVGNIGQNVESYDPATDAWTTKAKAPSVRYQDAGAVLNGLLYVVGGGTGTEYQALLDVYTPRTNSWRVLSGMPTERGFLGAAALGGRLYAVGGLTLDGYVATNAVYTPPR